MSGPALDYAYRYTSPSAAVPTPGGLGLRLATCGGERDARRAVSDYLRGGREGLAAFRATLPGAYAEYLNLRRAYYRAEARWPASPYWQRRRL
jgi:hypothetical protein